MSAKKEARLLILTQRMSKILSLVVETYVRTGQPVGSKKICELMKNSPSAATVRNEMASLTALGLLEQPHISSGRVPSLDGYRFYVSFLMTNKVIADDEKSYILGMFNDVSFDPESIIKKSCSVLSNITNCLVAFVAPSVEDSFVKDIKFVKVGKRAVILILVTSSGMVQNQIFNCDFEVNSKVLEMFKQFVKSEFLGRYFKDLEVDMQNIVVQKDLIIIPAFEAAVKAIKKICNLQVGIKGERFLFDFQKVSNAFEILDLIDKKQFSEFLFSSSNNIKIYIGNDCGMDVFSNCCIIVEKYNIGLHQGAISIIGPTRLDYPNVIAKMRCVVRIIQELCFKIVNF